MQKRPFYIDDSSRMIQSAQVRGLITARDQELAEAFVTERRTTHNISVGRGRTLLSYLVMCRKLMDADYDQATITDIYNLVNRLKSNGYKSNTVSTAILTLKLFYPWLVSNGHSQVDLQKIKAIRAPAVDRRTHSASEMLTQDEVACLIKAAWNSHDRALISVLYESGSRIGEACSITWSQLNRDEYGYTLNLLDNKNKVQRFVRLVSSAEYLNAWRNDYPGDPAGNAPVFVARRKYKGSNRTYDSTRSQLIRIAEKAGIKKKVHPHIFRHSRITHLMQQGYSESVIKLMIWGNLDTGMFTTYAHLTGQDIDREMLAKAGLLKEQPQAETDPLRPRICPHCQRRNAPTDDYCTKCGTGLTDEARAKQASKVDADFSLLESHPVFKLMQMRQEQLKQELLAEIRSGRCA